MRGRAWVGVLALAAVAMAGPVPERVDDPADPMLDGDPLDPRTGRAAEVVPDAPWIRWTGRGWRVEERVRGDVDLVTRSGAIEVGAKIPPPAAASVPPTGTAEPFGQGTALTVTVVPSDGAGAAVQPPYWEKLPILVAAFPDLDGDGYVGVTNRDGNRRDASLERAEYVQAGRAFVFGDGAAAAGPLVVGVGGPAAAPTRVALVAAGYAGPIDPDYRDGVFPDGPAVMTALPFLPVTDPEVLLRSLPLVPIAPEPGSRVAVEVQVAFAPDGRSRRLRESFALALDGSEASIDAALVRSGAVSRIGLARRADPAHYRPLAARPLRLGLDAQGGAAPLEILTRLGLDDDGAHGRAELVLVPLDRLGNVADLEAPVAVTVRTSGVAVIAEPDRDGNPFSETVTVEDARGTALVLDDTGGRFDGANSDVLLIESGPGLARVDLTLADPDVDDSGQVTWRDLLAVLRAAGTDRDMGGFEHGLDLDGDGVIDRHDLRAVAAHLWRTIPIP